MHLFRIWLLLLFWYFGVTADSSGDILENSKNILEQLKDAADAGLDLYGEFKAIIMEAASTIKLINPAANLGNALNKLAVQPESKEAKLLKQLDKKITDNYNQLSHHVHHEISAAIIPLQAIDYRINVNVALEDIRAHLKYVLNPISGAPGSAGALAAFKHKCTNSSASPWKILTKINAFVSCGRTIDQAIDLYLDFKELTSRLVAMSKSKLDDDFLLYEEYGFGTQYTRIVGHWNGTKIISNIQHLLNTSTPKLQSIAEIQTFLDNYIENITKNEKFDFGGCFIDNFMSKNKMKTNTALRLGIYIERDIRLSLLIGSFCLGVAHSTDGLWTTKLHNLTTAFTKLSTRVPGRILGILEATWPKVDLHEIMRLMKGLSFADTSNEELQQKATKIFDQVNTIGMGGYAKQVVTTAYGYDPDSYSLKCKPEFCVSYNSTNKKGDYGISTVVARTPDPNYSIRSSAKWSETNRKKIESLMITYAPLEFNNDFLGSIEHEVGKLDEKDRSHGFLLIRERSYVTAMCIPWYARIKAYQLPVHANKTLDLWRSGITAMSGYVKGGLFSSGSCSTLYIFA